MSVSVNIPQFFQHLTGDVNRADVNGKTVSECLHDLVAQFPRLKARIFEDNGDLMVHLEIFINGESAYPGEMEKPVKDGDELYVANAIVGG